MDGQTKVAAGIRRGNQVFVDQYGFSHRLIEGHRSKIKPGWERMLPDEPAPLASDEEVSRKLHEIASRVRLGVKMLRILGCRLDGRRVLDVGCDSGEEVMYLAGAGAASVVGSNYTQPGREDERTAGAADGLLDDSNRTRRWLLGHLKELGQLERFHNARVSFVDDNIASSSFGDESFDVLCSWRTLEHLVKPKEALTEMYRVLRPGGFAFHEYNPFFAIDGGHSLVTLDIPWGHVRLGAADVDRYLQQFRPQERVTAMNYYRHHLNRLTIGELERLARDVGFQVLALIPRARTEDLLELTDVCYDQARCAYREITMNDLLSRVVRVVLRRP